MRRSSVVKTTLAPVAIVVVVCVCVFGQGVKSATTPKMPTFKYDGAWPKLPLPNAWTFEGITGLTVDKDDVVWVLERPGDFDNDPIFPRARSYRELRLAQSAHRVVLQEAAGGARVRSGRQPRAQLESGRAERTPPDPCRQSRQHLGRHRHDAQVHARTANCSQRFRARPSPSDRSSRASIPGDAPMVVGGIEGGEFYESARELFVTDNYLRGRVLVFDMDTLKFKRGWGAYGKPLKDIAVTQDFKYAPGVAPPKDFAASPDAVRLERWLCLCRRSRRRSCAGLHQGRKIREGVHSCAPETLDRGSTGGLTFSRPTKPSSTSPTS